MSFLSVSPELQRVGPCPDFQVIIGVEGLKDQSTSTPPLKIIITPRVASANYEFELLGTKGGSFHFYEVILYVKG